jgi:uncharacterized protein
VSVSLRLLWTWLLTLLTMLASGGAHAQDPAAQFKPVPALEARVTDQVGMLTLDQRGKLENVLADYEKQTGSQIGVLLVASTEPEAIEQYSIRVADAWKLGRKGIDDGVLLVVARDNPKALRRLRIEAGRGVQGVLTDAQSKRILQDTIAPHFRQNDYYGGLVAGVGAIATLLNQEKFPAPQAQPGVQRQPAAASGGSGVMGSIFMIAVGLMFIRAMLRGRRSRLVQPGLRGGMGNAGSSWGSGATGFVIGNILANAASDDDDRRRDGGFSGSDGFSDSGGFSGGGGSFDGGGASGDW